MEINYSFAKFLLDADENNSGIFNRIDNTGIINIPDDLLIHDDLPNIPETHINVIFHNIFSETIENEYAILTTRNCDCNVISSIAIRKF